MKNKHHFNPLLSSGFAICACFTFISPSARATILANPSITGGSNAYGQSTFNAGAYAASNVFNGNASDYASAGQGANTFLQFTFPGAVTFDSMVVVNRDSPAGTDLVGNYTLTLSSGSESITRTAARGQGGIDSIGPVTTTTVRLDVDTLGAAGTGNTGAMEIYFLKTPDGMKPIPGVSVTASSNNPFGTGFVATNAINGIIGRDNSAEFASNAGVNTFVDFSFGVVRTVTGFDFFDRMAADAKVSSFDLIFSMDDTWGNGDDITRHYTGSTQSDNFAGISAKNVRYDVTGISGTNVGMNEIRFFELPAPGLAWKSTTDGTWDIGGATNWNDGTGAVAFTNGRHVTFDDSASITTVNVAVAVAPASITVSNPTKDYIIGGSAITGGTGLTKSEAGNLTLTGVNDFTGGMTITAGTVTIGGAGQLGGGSYIGNIVNSGNFVYNSSASQTLAGTLSGAGSATVSNGVLALSSATNSAIAVSASGTLNLTNPIAGYAGRATRTGNISGAGTVNINGGGAGVAGGWIKLSSGGGNFTGFTGAINVNSGVLTMDNLNGTLTGNPTMNVVAGGVFGIRGQNVSLGALTGDGDVANDYSGDASGHTLTLGANDGSGTFAGNVHGNASGADGTLEAGKLFLAKSGSGTQTLGGANTYTGSTTIHAGTLAFSSSATLASNMIAVDGGARLDVSALGAGITLTGGSLTAGRTSGFAEDVKGNITLDDSDLTIGGSGPIAGTLSQTGNLTLNNCIVNCDLAAATTVGGGVNDMVNVTGDLALTGISDIAINKLAGALSAGAYSLLSCSGTLTGTTAELNLVGLPDTARQSFALAISGKTVQLIVTGDSGNLTWTGTDGAHPTFWDDGTTANWSGSGGPIYHNGDRVLFDDNGVGTVEPQYYLIPGSVTFNNTIPYFLSGSSGGIDGGTGLTKNNTGTLSISTDNAYTGTTVINAGTVSVADLGVALGTGTLITLGDASHTGTLQTTATTSTNRTLALGAGGGILDVAPATTLTLSGGISGNASLREIGSGTLVLDGANSYTGATVIDGSVLSTASLAPNGNNSGIGSGTALTLNGGTLRYTGGSNGNETLSNQFNRAITLGAGGGTIDIAGSGFLFCNGSFTGSSALSILSTSGASPVRMLLYTGNSPGFSGPVSIGNGTANSGWLQYRSDAALPFGTGNITINTGGILSSDSGTTIPTVLTNDIILNGGTLGAQKVSTQFSGSVTVNASMTSYLTTNLSGSGANIVIAGNIAGSGTLVKNGGGFSVELRGDNSGFTGTYNATLGGTVIYAANAASAAASWNIPSGSDANARILAAAENATYELGSLSGTTGLLQNLSALSGNSVFKIGALNTSTAFNGVIKDNGGTVAITKVGATGTLTLGGANTYTGKTTVNAGTLAISATGSFSNTPLIDIKSGATLDVTAVSGGIAPLYANQTITGNGAVTGTVAVFGTYSAHVDSSGTPSAEKLTVSGAVAIQSGAILQLNDLAAVPVSLPSGATFTILSCGALSGAFAGLADGSTIPAGSNTFVIHYNPSSITLVKGGNYASWASTHGITGEASTVDHDNDGLANGVEYALGLDPTKPNGSPGTLAAGVLSFTKGADAMANGDVTYVIEESDDLGLADPWAAVVTHTPPNASATISHTLPAGKPKVFARLKISIQ